MKRILLLVALLGTALSGRAQLFPDYSLSIETTTWQSIASTGTSLTLPHYVYEQIISLPFDLEFGGATVPQGQDVKVSSRGRVNMGRYGAYSNAQVHWNLPSDEFAIIPFFVGQTEMPRYWSSVYWLSRPDDRGGQELVIEWNGLRRSGATGDTVSYQLHIHSNGDIAVCYGPMTLQAGYGDSIFTFAVVHDNASDRILTVGNWDTDSSITLANPSSIGSVPLMHGVPQEGLLLTLVRPLSPCPHPTHLTVADAWQQGATLTWTGNGVAGAQYLVQYDVTDFTPGTTGHPSMTVADTSCILSGLLTGQQYYAYVRSDCSPDTSRWEAIQFQTPCDAILHADLPYSQHFESAAEAACWRKLGTVNWSSQQNVSGTIIRYCNIFDGWAVMPPVDYLNDLQVSFRLTDGPVTVGVMDSPYDTASFVPLHSCPSNAAAWQNYTVRLSRYAGLGQYVAFVGLCHIDDVVLDTIQGCIAVENLRVVGRSATTAELRWGDYDSVGNYMVKWTDGITADSLVVATQGCTLTGLQPETQYSISVRILCDSITSGPETTIQFATYPTCMKPLAIGIDSITRSNAVVHWTEANTPGTYLVMLRYSPGDTISVDTVVGDTTLVVSLPRVARYYAEVRQLCSGTWTDEVWDFFENDYSCGRPQGIAVDSTADSTAVLTIADTVGTDHLVVLTHGYYTDTIVPTGLQFTLTGLMPATQYTVQVYNRCTDSTLSDYVSTTFATACSMVTHADLPYVETFDSCVPGSANTLSPCWTIRSFAPSNYVGLYRPVNNQYHGTAGNSLYVNVLQPDSPMFVALPEVDSLSDLKLSMWVFCLWTGDSKMDIGVMSNPDDTTTFQPIGTYIPTMANQWVEVEAAFRGFEAAGHYPAIRLGATGGIIGSSFYIDDVVIDYNLSCSRPDSLYITDITHLTATLNIVPSTEGDTAVMYQVSLASHYDTATFHTTSTTVPLGPLHPATDYTVAVRSLCVEGRYTLATTAQFTTPCGSYRLPWFENFEYQPMFQIPRCWVLTDSASTVPEVRWVRPSAYSGENRLLASVRDSGSFSSFATPELEPYAGPAALSAMVKMCDILGYSDTMPCNLQIGFMVGDSIVELYNVKTFFGDWTLVEVPAPMGMLANGGRFVFTFTRAADTTFGSAVLQLDDVAVRAVCAPVSGLEVVVVDTIPAGVEVHWHPMGLEQQWEVAIWNDTFSVVFGSPDTTVDLVRLGRLANATDYYIAVRPVCSIGDTGQWSDTVAFHTPGNTNPEGIVVASGQWPVVSVTPNPASGVAVVRCEGAAGEWRLSVIDAAGREAASVAGHDREARIDCSRLPAGVYFLRLGGSHAVGKLVVR